jgi:hypothetical protein
VFQIRETTETGIEARFTGFLLLPLPENALQVNAFSNPTQNKIVYLFLYFLQVIFLASFSSYFFHMRLCRS